MDKINDIYWLYDIYKRVEKYTKTENKEEKKEDAQPPKIQIDEKAIWDTAINFWKDKNQKKKMQRPNNTNSTSEARAAWERLKAAVEARRKREAAQNPFSQIDLQKIRDAINTVFNNEKNQFKELKKRFP